MDLFVEGREGRSLRVRVGSLRFTARLQGDVRPGAWYRAVVTRSGSATVFKTVERAPSPVDVSTLARSHGLNSVEGEAVLEGFIRTGLPLASDRLQLAMRRLRSAERLSVSERARLAAILEDKGLLDSDVLWERAVEAAGGEMRRDDTGRREGDRDGGERTGPHDDDSEGSGDEREDEGDASQDPRDEPQGREAPAGDRGGGLVRAAPALAEGLRRIFTTESPLRHALQLINHRRGRGDQWVVVPLRFHGTDEFRASLRIRGGLEQRAGAPEQVTFREAILDVHDGDERWTFSLTNGEGRMTVTVLEVPEAVVAGDDVPSDLFLPLEEALDEHGIAFHHRLMSKDSNDGFSSQDVPAIIRSVDSRA